MNITIATDDLLSVKEAAEQLNRPRITIYRWVETGRIVSLRLGGVIYIPRSEVKRLGEETTNGKQEIKV